MKPGSGKRDRETNRCVVRAPVREMGAPGLMLAAQVFFTAFSSLAGANQAVKENIPGFQILSGGSSTLEIDSLIESGIDSPHRRKA